MTKRRRKARKVAPKTHGMSAKPYASLLVALFLMLGLVAALVGCMGEEETAESIVTVVSEPSTGPTESPDEITGEDGLPAEELSTFESKDPFVQQAVPTETTGPNPTDTTQTTSPTDTTDYNTTTTYHTTTTRYYNTTTTWWTTTTHPSTTTTTKPATTTTTKPPYVHTLKILSVEEVGGAPACTFKVDSTVYKDQRVGNVVSTSWGQIQVVDIALSSNVVTLLHGSETLTLVEGQQIYG
jgi:hypothetical protein